MAKYDALRDHLAANVDPEVSLDFAEIDALVQGLPDSARTRGSFWANDSKVQARAWRAAGWHVESTSLSRERVLFTRGTVGDDTPVGRGAGPAKPLTTKERIEAMPTLCPSCHTAVPSTLVCDYCG